MLLLWGEQDFVSPALPRAVAGAFPQAEVQPVAEAGHYILEDATELYLTKRASSWEVHEPRDQHRLLIDKQACERPFQRALVLPEAQPPGEMRYSHLTFLGLVHRINAIARGLSELGLGRGIGSRSSFDRG